MEINNIYNEDCLDVMEDIPDKSIDLTVTSPPYDNLREYNGFSFDFQSVIQELYRVTKLGGVVVWVVGDATIKGSETGTSFKQALYFKEVGFNLHDTMIWNKRKCASIGSLTRYESTFDYMFVFSKGKPKTVNIIKDKPNKHAGETQHGSARGRDGIVRKTSNYGKKEIAQFGRRPNVWDIVPYFSKKERMHPAPFPEQLAHDHILSWSSEGDIVFDPFMGSGTTAKMAIANNRKYIGAEISQEYINIANKRIEERQYSLV